MSNKRPLGLISATTLVAASMIGVGVYTTSGYTLAALGTPNRVIAAWLVGAVIAICGATGYASLAAKFGESGGEYLFLSRTLHPVAGVMAGWISLLAGFTGAIAIAALGLEHYAGPLLSSAQELPRGTLAITVVVVAAALHTIGVQLAARAQDLVVALKLLMIVTFIGFAISTIGSWEGFVEPTGDAAASQEFSFLSFANQLVWISFSFAGFNAAVYVSSEVAHPERNVPRALIGGTILVSIMYLLLNAVFVLAPPAAVITDAKNISQVAATAAAAIGGQQFTLLVRGVIVISLFTSVSALVMTGPRVYAKMADDGFLPSWFCFRDRPPVQAIWFQALIAVVAIRITTLQELLGYLGLTLSICSALTVAMLFVLRWRREPVALPFFGILPAFYVLATLILAALYAIQERRQAIAAAATLAIGLVLWILRGSLARLRRHHD